MKAEIKFWEAVILSNKKYEPITKEEMAAFDIAEFYLSCENQKTAA